MERQGDAMSDYNYSSELKEIFKDLRSLSKSRKYDKLYKDAPEHHKETLRKAYLTALKGDLLILRSSLGMWIEAERRQWTASSARSGSSC